MTQKMGRLQVALGGGLGRFGLGFLGLRFAHLFVGEFDFVGQGLLQHFEVLHVGRLGGARLIQLGLGLLQQAVQCVHDATAAALVHGGVRRARIIIRLLALEKCCKLGAIRRGQALSPHHGFEHINNGTSGLQLGEGSALHLFLNDTDCALEHINGVNEILLFCGEDRLLLLADLGGRFQISFVSGDLAGEILDGGLSSGNVCGVLVDGGLEVDNLALAGLECPAAASSFQQTSVRVNDPPLQKLFSNVGAVALRLPSASRASTSLAPSLPTFANGQRLVGKKTPRGLCCPRAHNRHACCRLHSRSLRWRGNDSVHGWVLSGGNRFRIRWVLESAKTLFFYALGLRREVEKSLCVKTSTSRG